MSWSIQDDNDNFKVKVSGDYCRDGEARTDVLIFDKETKEHMHISIDDEGEMTVQHDFR